MPLNQDDFNQSQNEFASAFNEDAPAPQEQTEDEAFGLTPDEPEVAHNQAEEAAEPESVAIVVADGDEIERAAQEDQARNSAEQANDDANQGKVVAAQPEDDDEIDVKKEIQRLKSWEGRLKAMEQQLKGAGKGSEEEQREVVGEAIEQASDSAPTEAAEEQVQQIADQVESGQITPEQAMRQLSEDFGDDFVKMIEAVAVSIAKKATEGVVNERVGQVGKTVEAVVNDINDTKMQSHFNAIEAAHPDFEEVAESPEFAQYLENLPEDQKAEAQRIATSGTAKEVIGLLNGFKAAHKQDQAATSTVDDEAMAAAEGVRSGSIRIPDQPKKGDNDFLAAWDDF